MVLKEVKYHFKHSAEWIIRLGDGTAESHARIQNSLDNLWRFTEELFFQDEVNEILNATIDDHKDIYRATAMLKKLLRLRG